MTPRQEAVLRAVRDLAADRGYPPTVREIAAHIGITSPSTVQAHLAALATHRLISHEPHSPRTLRLTAAGRAAL